MTRASPPIAAPAPTVAGSRRRELVRGIEGLVTEHLDELALLILGVLGAITVWNYPFLVAMFTMVPALVAGNVVITKPSPFTPVTTMRLGELVRELLPPGVVRVVTGGDGIGVGLTEHPGVHTISFTGSVATGNSHGGQVCAAEGVTAGPVQNAPQLERVRGLTEDALARGGEAFFRGEVPDGPGYRFPTTLVRGVAEGVPPVDEEPFGPVLPIMTYSDVDEVVDRANATDYGLGASVWSPDLDRATTVATRLEAGSVWVDQHPVVTATVPFGGAKQSGLGVEGSRHGRHAYTDVRVPSVKR